MDLEASSAYLDRIYEAETPDELQPLMDELTSIADRDPHTRNIRFLIGACRMRIELVSPDPDPLAPATSELA
jgi:hypothetical protein